MIIAFLPLVILAFAAFRITRFFIIDTITESVRSSFHVWLTNRNKLKPVFEKIYELTSCTWCFGFWVSLSLYWLYAWTSPLNWGRLGWLSAFAVAGIQGMIHALEPDNG